MNKSFIIQIILAVAVMLVLHSCSPADGNHTGHEFMPDMGHSIAYEANYYNYYSLNTWGSEEDYKKYAMPRLPVKGTIPRGYAGQRSDNMEHLQGKSSHTGISLPVNGSVPYYYEDTEEERTRAINEIVNNPFPISDAEMLKVKELYNTYCGICHGDKGDGAGYLVRDDGGVYPAQPANFLTDEFISASNGRYYHAIMYGKNVMSGYGDKLSFEERWQVIHYIRGLQAKEKGLDYNSTANTLNGIDIPEANWTIAVEEDIEETVEGEHIGDHHHEGGHDDNHSEEIQH